MVSVARDCSQLSGTYNTLTEVVTAWAESGQRELKKTPEQLVVDGKYVLKDAGVVDSGAAGFVNVIEGMLAVQ